MKKFQDCGKIINMEKDIILFFDASWDVQLFKNWWNVFSKDMLQ